MFLYQNVTMGTCIQSWVNWLIFLQRFPLVRANSYYSIGLNYILPEKYDTTVIYFKRAIDINSDPEYSTGLAMVYVETNQMDKAEKEFKRSIKLASTDSANFHYSEIQTRINISKFHSFVPHPPTDDQI